MVVRKEDTSFSRIKEEYNGIIKQLEVMHNKIETQNTKLESQNELYKSLISDIKNTVSKLDSVNESHKVLTVDVKDIIQKLNNYMSDRTLEKHITSQAEIIKNTLFILVKELSEKVMSAFPNQDPISHAKYHTEVIHEVNERKTRFNEIITFVIKNTIWAALAVIGVAIWFFIKANIKGE
jgi:chromosome segregation ATPase